MSENGTEEDDIKLVTREWKLVVRCFECTSRVVTFIVKIGKMEAEIGIVPIGFLTPVDCLAADVNPVVSPFDIQILGNGLASLPGPQPTSKSRCDVKSFAAPIREY